jgi:hypothetical protein
MNEEATLNESTLKNQYLSKIKELRNKIADKTKLLQTETDEHVREAYEKTITTSNEELEETQKELNALNEEKNKTIKKALEDLIRGTNNNDKLKRVHIAYIATDDKYVIIKNYSKTDKRVNIRENSLTASKMVGILNNLIGKPGFFDTFSGQGGADRLRTAFERAGASYMIRTSSFDDPKWDVKYVFNALQIQREFWAPIDQGDDYDPAFDDLMYSLGGGKDENIAHLEQWVPYKFLYPEKLVSTPNINLTGIPGGNGKGLFCKILSSVFTLLGVGWIKGKNLTGGFNANMEGKVINVFDDEKKDKFPNDELKQNTGNGNIVVEPKGVDSYTVDATANILVMDNTGLIKLVGGGSGGEDRRWSIITTEISLLDHLMQKYTLTADQAKKKAEDMAAIFEDRIACGKWLAAMIKKHSVSTMSVLRPLHGQDYQRRLIDQRDNWIEIFERVLPIFVDQKILPFKFLKEIVEAETGEKIKKPATLSSKFDVFLSRNGHRNVEKVEGLSVKIIHSKSPSSQENLRGAVRRLDPSVSTFDYAMISNGLYNKKDALTKESLNLRDFSIVEIGDVFENDAGLDEDFDDNSVEDYVYTEDDDMFTESAKEPCLPCNPAQPTINEAKMLTTAKLLAILKPAGLQG